MTGHLHDPCPERVDALERYLAGDAPSPELEAHLLDCRGCKQYMSRLRGIEAFLRQAHDRFEQMPAGALVERRRVVPAKVAVWAAMIVAVTVATCSLVLAGRSGVLGGWDRAASLEKNSAAPGRIIMVSGDAGTLSTSGEAPSPVALGSRVPGGSVLEVASNGAVAARWVGGMTIVAGPGSRVRMGAGKESRVLRVDDGSVTVLTQGTGALAAEIIAGAWRIASGGGVVTVRSGAGDMLEVESLRGEAVVKDPKGREHTVFSGQLLASSGSIYSPSGQGEGTLELIDVLAHDSFRSRLYVTSTVPALVTVDGAVLGPAPVLVLLAEGSYGLGLVAGGDDVIHSRQIQLQYGRDESIAIDAPSGDRSGSSAPEIEASASAMSGSIQEPVPGHAFNQTTAVSQPGDILARIRQALAGGDTDEALALVEKHWKWGSGDPAFLAVAGDTYRRAGDSGKAIEAFLAAAAKAKGPTAEKAFLDAARLALEATGDSQKADAILAAYWQRFPGGAYQSEASFLNARLLVKQKKYAQARTRLEALIAADPSGYLATKAHLLLGSVLVTYLADCAAAKPHLEHVKSAAPGGKFADEASLYLEKCAD